MSWARFENVREVTGLVHGENRAMLKMATELGFDLHLSENDPAISRGHRVSASRSRYCASARQSKKSGGMNPATSAVLSFVTTQLPLQRVRAQSHLRCGKEPYHWEPLSGPCRFRR